MKLWHIAKGIPLTNKTIIIWTSRNLKNKFLKKNYHQKELVYQKKSKIQTILFSKKNHFKKVTILMKKFQIYMILIILCSLINKI